METIKIIYEGELRTTVTHCRSGQTLVTDAPVDNQGKGEFFAPTDLLVTALGGCILTTMDIIAKKHNFDVTGVSLEARKFMGVEPRRVSRIELDIYLPRRYSDKEMKFIEKAIYECPVSKSLHSDVEKIVNFFYK